MKLRQPIVHVSCVLRDKHAHLLTFDLSDIPVGRRGALQPLIQGAFTGRRIVGKISFYRLRHTTVLLAEIAEPRPEIRSVESRLAGIKRRGFTFVLHRTDELSRLGKLLL